MDLIFFSKRSGVQESAGPNPSGSSVEAMDDIEIDLETTALRGCVAVEPKVKCRKVLPRLRRLIDGILLDDLAASPARAPLLRALSACLKGPRVQVSGEHIMNAMEKHVDDKMTTKMSAHRTSKRNAFENTCV